MPEMKKSELMSQIEIAKKRSQKLRQAAPYLFREYQELCARKREYKEAKASYAVAKETWRRLKAQAEETDK